VRLPAHALAPPAGPPGSAPAGGGDLFGGGGGDDASPNASLLASLAAGGGGGGDATPGPEGTTAADDDQLIALGAGTPSPRSGGDAFAAAFGPVSLLEAARSAAVPAPAAPAAPPTAPLRPAPPAAVAAIATGAGLVLMETWRAAHVGGCPARAGVLGEVRAAGGAGWAGTDAAAAFALVPPPAGPASSPATEAALRAALLDPRLARPPAPGRAGAGRGPALVAKVGADPTARTPPAPILRYRAPPAAIPPPALARLAIHPPPTGGEGAAAASANRPGWVGVLEWAVAPGLPAGAAPLAGWVELSVPDSAAGVLVRAHPPGGVWDAAGRRLRWRLAASALAPGASGRVWAAFRPAAPGPDALALAGVPGGGPAAAARACATALLRAVRPAGAGGMSLTGTSLVSGAADGEDGEGQGGGGSRARAPLVPSPAGAAWHIACRPDA